MMGEKYLLVQHSSPINAVIHQTFQTTQRIKFTAFDVSTRFIIFGVSSGGIYIFSRESCQFVKLIPSNHGPPILLAISGDEQYVAAAVATGPVIIFDEDCHQHIFREHEGTAVTAMKWNGDQLYCGDSMGRVSTVTLLIMAGLQKKTIFQTPASCVMQLDSPVFQLDAHCNFLLVSTQTRALLCNTETERYKQIGKKPRMGGYGSCFLNEKVYCARPGARLWEADFQGNVVLTLDFRPSLEEKPSDIIFWDEGADAAFKIITQTKKCAGEFNFGKVFEFLDKFMLTFNDNGFYIFEPSSSVLLCQTNHINSIKDIKLINSTLYIWHNDVEISILSFLTVEELIVRSLLKKQYDFCGEFCVRFLNDIFTAIDTSKKVHLVSILETKLQNQQLLKDLAPIFARLKEILDKLSLEKVENGVVTVNALPITTEQFQNNVNNSPYQILLEQYKINKLHKNIQTVSFIKLMKSSTNNDLHGLIVKFQQETDDSSDWCREIFLRHLDCSEGFTREVFEFACEAFFHLNKSLQITCECNFPLPEVHKKVPQFCESGCRLLEQCTYPETFLENVPYMNKFILQRITDPAEIKKKIPLIIQFSDAEVVDALCSKITYDVWDQAVELVHKLKNGSCLNCGRTINVVGALDWNSLGVAMVRSIKATNAIKLLSTHSHIIPQNELNHFFYQYCIFFSAANANSRPFNEILASENAQLDLAVGKYLRRRYLFGTNYERKSSEPNLNCDHCKLPLKIPIIEDVTRLPCGHNYHQMCFLANANQCYVCSADL